MTLDHSKTINDDFNISTDESTNVLDLGNRIWKKIKGDQVPFEFVSDSPFPHDVQKRIPDTTKAKQILGFEATTSIDQVLDEVIPWVKDAITKNLI